MDDNRFYVTSEGGFWFVKINDHVFKHGSAEEATGRLIEYFRSTLGRREFRSVIVSCPQFVAKSVVNPEVKDYVDTNALERKAQRDQELIRKARKALADLAEAKAKAGLK